jgi:hypothetical protein
VFRLDRSRKAGRWLEWKVRIFSVGAVLALVGIYLDERWMTGAAIGVLLLGFVLRFLPGMNEERDDEEERAGGESEDADRIA